MPKYLVSYTETQFYSIEAEADSRDEAEDKAKEIWNIDPSLFKYGEITDSFFQCEGEV